MFSMSKREYRQAVRKCQELGVTMDMLPIPNYDERVLNALDPWEGEDVSSEEEFSLPSCTISVKLFDKLKFLAA